MKKGPAGQRGHLEVDFLEEMQEKSILSSHLILRSEKSVFAEKKCRQGPMKARKVEAISFLLPGEHS